MNVCPLLADVGGLLRLSENVRHLLSTRSSQPQSEKRGHRNVQIFYCTNPAHAHICRFDERSPGPDRPGLVRDHDGGRHSHRARLRRDRPARAVGALDGDDFFDYGSLSYRVVAIDVAPNVVRFAIEPGGQLADETLTLEFGGHAFAFSDRLPVSLGQNLYWSVPAALDDLETEFPVGSTATVCLRTATQVCPAAARRRRARPGRTGRECRRP